MKQLKINVPEKQISLILIEWASWQYVWKKQDHFFVDQDDFDTERQTNVAAVVAALQMWGVKDVVSFPVIDGDASLQTDTDREGHRCGEFSSHWCEYTECFNHWHSVCSD